MRAVIWVFLVVAAAMPARAGLSDEARQVVDNWVWAVNQNDADASVVRFDDQSELIVAADQARTRGKADARAYFKTLFTRYRVEFRLTRRTANVLPVLIGETGNFEENLTPKDGGATIHRSGHFVIHYLRSSTVTGGWAVQKMWF